MRRADLDRRGDFDQINSVSLGEQAPFVEECQYGCSEGILHDLGCLRLDGTIHHRQRKLFGIEQLNVKRSTLPAITHVDYSARIQTVHKDTNPRYYDLLKAFEDRTGCGVLVNTSFNVRGEPIVCTPEDAYRCFMRTEMDYLVIENCLFAKSEQPDWSGDDSWKDEF